MPRATTAVDVLDHQVVEHVVGSAAGTGQIADRGILDVEPLQLGPHRCRDLELLADPEVLVGTQDVGESRQEGGLQDGGALLVLDVGDPPALVDELEEGARVVRERLPAHGVDHLVETCHHRAHVRAATRSEVAVQARDRLDVGRGRHQLRLAGVLAPLDTIPQHEAGVTRQAEERSHRR